MNQSMLIVNGPGQKTLITHVTLERPFSSVHFSYMVLQIGPDSVPGFTTFVRTCKRLDSYITPCYRICANIKLLEYLDGISYVAINGTFESNYVRKCRKRTV